MTSRLYQVMPHISRAEQKCVTREKKRAWFVNGKNHDWFLRIQNNNKLLFIYNPKYQTWTVHMYTWEQHQFSIYRKNIASPEEIGRKWNNIRPWISIYFHYDSRISSITLNCSSYRNLTVKRTAERTRGATTSIGRDVSRGRLESRPISRYIEMVRISNRRRNKVA